MPYTVPSLSDIVAAEPVKVLVWDELPLLRDALANRLDIEDDIKVVGTADSRARALALFEASRPDVVLTALSCHHGAGLELESRAMPLSGSLSRTLVFYACGTDEEVARLLRSGVKGVLHRGSTGDEVVSGVRAVARGQTVLDSRAVDQLLRGFEAHRDAPGDPSPAAAAPAAIGGLTSREQEVLVLLGRDGSVEAVARELFIEVSTVRTHLHRIRHKLGLRDRAELVAFAHSRGLIPARVPASPGSLVGGLSTPVSTPLSTALGRGVEGASSRVHPADDDCAASAPLR